ncbi:5152_t:CDS:1, partial [Dentiscutata erythropus]
SLLKLSFVESLLVSAIVCDVVAYWSRHLWCRACWGRHSFCRLLKPSFIVSSFIGANI